MNFGALLRLIFAKTRSRRCSTLPGKMKHTLLSAGVVIVHSREGRCRYLLLRCFRYWDFPKGVVEEGETPLFAACREVHEETDIDALTFSWGQPFIETAPYGIGKVARYYLAASADEKVRLLRNPHTGRVEHEEYRWLEYGAARQLLDPRVRLVIDWAHTLSGC
jgi:bis(5'-nucleosidyl)-tetraphosphatase